MGFEELRGQTRVVELLKAGAKAGRIAHAYLFHGPAGVGKKKAALIFSRFLNCERSRDGEPCDVCTSCHKIKSGGHPDVIEIRPDGSAIKIAQIRALQGRAYYKCYEGAYKVLIIDDADAMTIEAANSLLKILEEPPAQTVFILLAEDKGRIPDTILSRSQLVSFSPLDEAMIKNILAQRGIRDAAPLAIARGSVGKALQLLEKADYGELRDNVERLLQELKTGGYHEIMSWAEKTEKGEDRLEVMLDLLAGHYRDVMHREIFNGATAAKTGDLQPEWDDRIKRSCQALEEIDQAFGKLKQNANARLVLEVLLLNLRNIEQKERGSDPIG